MSLFFFCYFPVVVYFPVYVSFEGVRHDGWWSRIQPLLCGEPGTSYARSGPLHLFHIYPRYVHLANEPVGE